MRAHVTIPLQLPQRNNYRSIRLSEYHWCVFFFYRAEFAKGNKNCTSVANAILLLQNKKPLCEEFKILCEKCVFERKKKSKSAMNTACGVHYRLNAEVEDPQPKARGWWLRRKLHYLLQLNGISRRELSPNNLLTDTGLNARHLYDSHFAFQKNDDICGGECLDLGTCIVWFPEQFTLVQSYSLLGAWIDEGY